MAKYTLKIQLLSDNRVSEDYIIYDEYNLPYYKGKSIKDHMRDMINILIENQKSYNMKKAKVNERIADKLFGEKLDNNTNDIYIDDKTQGVLKFENASISDDTKLILKYLIDTNIISKDGIVLKDNTLKNIKILTKGSIFYSNIYTERELSDEELGLLLCGVNGFRQLGISKDGKKVEVKCNLLKEDKIITSNNVKKLINKVIR